MRFGTLFLSGSWDGPDWQWLRGLMSYRTEDEGLSDESFIPAFTWPNIDSRSTLVRSAAAWFTDKATPGSMQVLERVLDLLTEHMLVTYAPWPYQVVRAMVDTATLTDETRSLIRDASQSVGTSPLANTLRNIAESSRGYLALMGSGAG